MSSLEVSERGPSTRGPLRIAFVITGLRHGGAESQLLQLSRRFLDRGWDVLVVSLISRGTLAPEFERAGIPVASLDLARGGVNPRAPWKLAALLRSFRPHVVHGHLVHGNLLARLSRLFYRAPVVISTVHSVQEGGRWRAFGIRITDSLGDLTTVVSQAVADRYLRDRLAPETKLRVVPNGVDTGRFRPDPGARHRVRQDLGVDGCFVWLAIGRLIPAKDYPTLFEAFALSLKCGHDLRLFVVGDGPLRTQCKEVIAGLGIGRRVEFLGVREDIAELLNAADGYVMSSAWEGLPMVLLEASASELPILATDVGGNREIVAHGETGFLVPPKDPVALAAAMERLAAAPASERSGFGTEARRRMEESFALNRVLDQWVELYHQLLARSTRVA